MATYRCRSCGGIYVSPQPPGLTVYHACPDQIRNAAGVLIPTPDPRNENVEEVLTVVEGEVRVDPKTGARGIVRMIHKGKGRVKLSDQDVLTGATPAQLLALQQAPGVPVPDP